MTKRGIDIQSEAEPSGLDALKAAWKCLRLWDAIGDTVKWSRLYGGAVAVLLIDGQRFDTPLRVETVGRDSFKGLLVLDRWQVQPTVSASGLITNNGALQKRHGRAWHAAAASSAR